MVSKYSFMYSFMGKRTDSAQVDKINKLENRIKTQNLSQFMAAASQLAYGIN